jgi:RNA polymerase sigma-70 factor (ECF subfamily)
MKQTDFSRFLAGVRAGDGAAAEELLRRYEPYLRRLIRLRLHDPRLRRLLESRDICQSILADFFARAARGEFDLESHEQLAGLLLTMARNKLVTQARRNHKHRGSLPPGWDAADSHPSPAQQAAERELLQAARARLSPEELWLFEQNKVRGRTWDAIAQEKGADANALRMRLTRALARVRRTFEAEAGRHVC